MVMLYSASVLEKRLEPTGDGATFMPTFVRPACHTHINPINQFQVTRIGSRDLREGIGLKLSELLGLSPRKGLLAAYLYHWVSSPSTRKSPPPLKAKFAVNTRMFLEKGGW